MSVTESVIGENFAKYRKTNTKEKFRISPKMGKIRNFLVEISGIEPLTS